MLQASKNGTIREAVGVFKDFHKLEKSIDELSLQGFDRAQFSLLANEETVQKKLGKKYNRIKELLDNPNTPREAYYPNETIGEAQGAILALSIYTFTVLPTAYAATIPASITTTIAIAIIGGIIGLKIGQYFAKKVMKHHKNYINKQKEHGGIALWIRTWNKRDEKLATNILKKHKASNVHTHSIKA